MSVYPILLTAHSYVRWVVVALAVALLARSVVGALRAQRWSKADDRTFAAFVASADVQLALGLWLIVSASPIARAFFADPRRAMKIAGLRFFGIEHPTAMLGALIVIHLGRRLAKRRSPHHRAAITAALSLALIGAGIPWPPLRYGRPLIRALPHQPSSAACPPLYVERCAACHGDRGRGDGPASTSLTPKPRDLSDAALWATRTDAEIAAVIREGGARRGLGAAMPANPDLTSAEVTSLVTCVRSFPSNAP